MSEEAAHANVEKLLQEQQEQDVIAAQSQAQEDHAHQGREAEEAQAKVQAEADVVNEDVGEVPGKKLRKLKKRACIIGDSDADGDNKEEEGDGERVGGSSNRGNRGNRWVCISCR